MNRKSASLVLLHHLSLHPDVAASLQADLNSALVTRSTLAQSREQVGDVVPRMAVKTGAQSLLVEVVSNQTDAAAEDEKTVEDTHVEVVLGLLGGEGAAVAEQVDEAHSNTAIHVEDQVVFLGGGDGFDSDGIVEEFMGGEVLHDELFDELDPEIGIGTRLDTVTDTGN
jgi:hypothetical protein